MCCTCKLRCLSRCWLCVSLPERYVATRVRAELEQDAAVIATAVLVEEEEKEEEEKPEPICSVTEPSPNLEKKEEGPAQDTDTKPAPEPTTNDDGQKTDQSDIAQVPAEPILVELSEEEEEPPNTGSSLGTCCRLHETKTGFRREVFSNWYIVF